MPDHIINTVSDSIQGLKKSTNRQPPARREPYRRQAQIGWCNFVRGRLSKAWISQKPSTATSTDDPTWMITLTKTILGALAMKWEIRCRIAADSQATRELSRLQDEAFALWSNRASYNLLAQDSSLMEDKFSPDKKWGADALRNWIMTRKLAISASESVALAQRNTLDSWIQRPGPNIS